LENACLSYNPFINRIINQTDCKTQHSGHKYSLSELGESMRPILESMQAWGTNYKQLMEQNEE
jgi:DNA-binding HxlR family transcriptional regulator